MTTASRFLGILMVTLALAAPARAETIAISSGALNWVPGRAATVTMAGDGFTFTGAASPSSGIFTPWLTCIVPECTAGGSVDLFSFWSGSDLPGTATLNGQTYPAVGSVAGTSSLAAQWTGTLAIPSDFTGGLLTAPFLFSGEFRYEVDPTLSWSLLDLVGAGTASLAFTPYPNEPGAFSLTSVRYEFDAAAVPEPTSMLLIGTGLAGLAAVRRRRVKRPTICLPNRGLE